MFFKGKKLIGSCQLQYFAWIFDSKNQRQFPPLPKKALLKAVRFYGLLKKLFSGIKMMMDDDDDDDF